MTEFGVSRYHSEIMFETIPELIDPVALAEKKRRFRGVFPLAKMTRLADVLASDEGEVRFELNFAKEGGIAAIVGKVEAKLSLRCQCCLGELPWQVVGELRLGAVRSLEEADLLPEGYEPLLLEEDVVPALDIVQDEVLLAIPAIPRHDGCVAPAVEERQEQTPEPARRENPFAVLSALKREN